MASLTVVVTDWTPMVEAAADWPEDCTLTPDVPEKTAPVALMRSDPDQVTVTINTSQMNFLEQFDYRDWQVPLARPRDISEVRMEREFHELHREIWSVLKDEVMKGYAQSTQAGAA